MSKKITFSIPYNGDLDLMRWAIKSGQVYEIYFSGPVGNDYSSVCRNSRGYSPDEIMALVNLCAENGIARNFLMNKSILFFDDLKEIFLYLRQLDAAGGITSVTVADRAIVPHLLKVIPNVKIQSSVFLHIDSAPKVREAVKMGITEFCLGVTANRNGFELERIKVLRKTFPQIKIKLLANHGCYLNCFYSAKHGDWSVLVSLREKNPKGEKRMLVDFIDEGGCLYKTADLTDEIRRPFIRPEDIAFYEKKGWTDYIKLAYRFDETPVLKRRMEAYFNRRYDGDLCEIAPQNRGRLPVQVLNSKFPEGFIEKLTSCGSVCEGCRYCARVLSLVSSGHKQKENN